MRILLLSFGENGLELLESLGSDGMEMEAQGAAPLSKLSPLISALQL